jgi:hypothetical protein
MIAPQPAHHTGSVRQSFQKNRFTEYLPYGKPETMTRPLKVPPISLNLHMTILIHSFRPSIISPNKRK